MFPDGTNPGSGNERHFSTARKVTTPAGPCMQARNCGVVRSLQIHLPSSRSAASTARLGPIVTRGFAVSANSQTGSKCSDVSLDAMFALVNTQNVQDTGVFTEQQRRRAEEESGKVSHWTSVGAGAGVMCTTAHFTRCLNAVSFSQRHGSGDRNGWGRMRTVMLRATSCVMCTSRGVCSRNSRHHHKFGNLVEQRRYTVLLY